MFNKPKDFTASQQMEDEVFCVPEVKKREIHKIGFLSHDVGGIFTFYLSDVSSACLHCKNYCAPFASCHLVMLSLNTCFQALCLIMTSD